MWPDCAVNVPPRMWGCREHWFKLPRGHRDAITRAYVPGQGVGDWSAAYAEAQQAAEDYANAHDRVFPQQQLNL